jgi:hypothetical protein
MDISLKETERLSQNSENIFREEEDGAFLFDPETGNLKYINTMGVNIYQLCDGSMTVGDITAIVIESYRDISREQIENDVKYFFMALVEMNFLKREEASDD